MFDRYVVTSLLIGLVVIYFSWGFIKDYKQYKRYEKGVHAFENNDYENAFKDIMPHAKRGNVDARFYIGTIHALGLGKRQDKGVAVHWFSCSTIKNCTSGQQEYKLAKGCFEEKWGTYSDAACLQWMRISGRLEYPPALKWLREYKIQKEKNDQKSQEKQNDINKDIPQENTLKHTAPPGDTKTNTSQGTKKAVSDPGKTTPDQPESNTSGNEG